MWHPEFQSREIKPQSQLLMSLKLKENIPNHSSKPAGGFIRPAEVLDKFDLQEGMKVADFGCGSGYFTLLVARKVGKNGMVYAIDIVDSALDSVRSTAKIYSLLNIETIRGDLEREKGSTLPDKSVDVVLIANILFQAKDRRGVINEAKRVAKEKGKVVIIEWSSDSAIGPPRNSRISKEEMKELASSAGLAIEKEFDAGGSHYGLVFSV